MSKIYSSGRKIELGSACQVTVTTSKQHALWPSNKHTFTRFTSNALIVQLRANIGRGYINFSMNLILVLLFVMLVCIYICILISVLLIFFIYILMFFNIIYACDVGKPTSIRFQQYQLIFRFFF